MNAALELLLRLLRSFEGCKLKAYQDIVGIWTICFGETLGVVPGMTQTQTGCDLMLSRRAQSFLLRVLQICPALADDPRRLAAVSSLAYNIGLGAFRASTLKRKCARREWQAAAAQFYLWNKAGGRPVRGLTLRRTVECRVFLHL